jgi:putative DNA primase/helicase
MPEGPSRTSSPPATDDAHAVPDEVKRRFVQVGHTFYFPDGARAFSDRGRKLTTPSENTEVIRSLVTIAQARGWTDITLTGTERFRKEAWHVARLAGLDVRGYKPSDFEQEHLVRSLARHAASHVGDPAGTRAAPSDQARSLGETLFGANAPPSRSPDRPRERRGGLIVGRLVDHGRATYRHDPQEPMSYFVKLETDRGERLLWGVDFERALRESLTKPQVGDEVGVRAVRQDAVTVKAFERDAEGRVLSEKNLNTLRNRWIIEKRGFFEARAAAARVLRDPQVEPRRAREQHPELAGSYLQLRGAEEVATRRIRDPEDQRKFVALVRNALADQVARGEPLPPVRLREPQPKSPEARTPSRERVSTRSAPSLDREQVQVRG